MNTQTDISSLFLDAHQGQQKNGRAFGFIGNTDDYQGWFFVWPGERATISTEAELQAVLDSLEADEIHGGEAQIPKDWAREKLEKFLRAKFDVE